MTYVKLPAALYLLVEGKPDISPKSTMKVSRVKRHHCTLNLSSKVFQSQDTRENSSSRGNWRPCAVKVEGMLINTEGWELRHGLFIFFWDIKLSMWEGIQTTGEQQADLQVLIFLQLHRLRAPWINTQTMPNALKVIQYLDSGKSSVRSSTRIKGPPERKTVSEVKSLECLRWSQLSPLL